MSEVKKFPDTKFDNLFANQADLAQRANNLVRQVTFESISRIYNCLCNPDDEANEGFKKVNPSGYEDTELLAGLIAYHGRSELSIIEPKNTRLEPRSGIPKPGHDPGNHLECSVGTITGKSTHFSFDMWEYGSRNVVTADYYDSYANKIKGKHMSTDRTAHVADTVRQNRTVHMSIKQNAGGGEKSYLKLRFGGQDSDTRISQMDIQGETSYKLPGGKQIIIPGETGEKVTNKAFNLMDDMSRIREVANDFWIQQEELRQRETEEEDDPGWSFIPANRE